MDFERHQNDLRVQRKANRTLGGIVALLALCQLLSLGVIASTIGWNISKRIFRAMIDSALGLDPDDMSEAAKAKRR